jgi:hypothetical protein
MPFGKLRMTIFFKLLKQLFFMKKYFLIFRDAGADGPTSGEAPLIGLADDAQIAAWKQSWPNGIFAVKKSGRIAYFKNPDFNELDAYYGLSKKNLKVSEEWKTLAGMLYLGGCAELKDSAKYLPNVIKRLQEAIAGEESELVNL